MSKYDNENVIVYLNEAVIKNFVPEDVAEGTEIKPYTAYQYTGTEPDGGTLIPSSDIGDRGQLVNGIIRTKYTASDELAIQRHMVNDSEKHAEEWREYNEFCEEAKRQADKILALL
ncbi:MAG: hypothetical protein J6C65_01975 [Prevotella sp.]|nr:hypothetical protein [Prevotella sp.]